MIILALLLIPLAGATTFEPKSVSATLNPGESIDETKLVITDPTPLSKADIVFSFDLTGSMSGTISTAKSQAISIMNDIDTLVPDAQYGVVSYMDYPHSYSSFGYSEEYGYGGYPYYDYAYKLSQPITSDKTAVQNAINSLVLGAGSDGPQDYTRVMYESYADTAISYRAGSKKILVNFGDNVPHDNNLNEGVTSGTWSTGGDPGRDEVMGTSDDLDLQTVLNGMKANGVTLLEVHGSSGAKEYWDYWTGITGGKDVVISSSSPAVITNAIQTLITGTVSSIGTLTLKPDTGYESWVTWTPDKYTSVGGTTTENFAVNIKVPAGIAPGTYHFQIHLIGDGAELGVQDVTITVPGSSTSVPEFPTVAIPVAAVLGLIFVFGRRKE